MNHPLYQQTLEIISATNQRLLYTYDDLIFVEEHHCIYQLEPSNSSEIHVYFNSACSFEQRIALESTLLSATVERSLTLVISGTYDIDHSDDISTIEVEYVE